MEKRTLLAVAVCMGILLLWWQLFPPPKPAPPAPVPAPAVQAPAAPSGGSAPATPPAAPGDDAPSAAAASAVPAERVILENDKARFVFSNEGAALQQVMLKETKFRKDRKDPDSGIELLGAGTADRAPLRISFPRGDFKLPERLNWQVARRGPSEVVFRTETEAVAVEKRFQTDGFHIALDVQIENKTGKDQSHSLAVHLFGHQDPQKMGGGFWDVASADMATLVCMADGSIERDPLESLFKEPEEKLGDVKWIAADTKYFVVAAVPHRENPPKPKKCGRRGFDALSGEVFLSFESRAIAPQAKTTYGFTVFAGPKYTDALEKVRPGGEDVELGNVVDVTFAILARPLLYLLKLFHGWVGNWGVAIIMLTLFVKLLTFYPTQRAMMSGKRMQKLAPKMAELRKKYEKDRQRMGVETMNLYKANGVSPFGGCLPTLLTMPIWIALFSTLNYAVELHREPFFGYIRDLSARDPYFITPLLMGGIMYLQMRMSPAGADPQQQKMMSVMMPVMFTAFSLFLPAGLAMYTLTNSLLAILQQLLINHIDARETAAGRA